MTSPPFEAYPCWAGYRITEDIAHTLTDGRLPEKGREKMVNDLHGGFYWMFQTKVDSRLVWVVRPIRTIYAGQ